MLAQLINNAGIVGAAAAARPSMTQDVYLGQTYTYDVVSPRRPRPHSAELSRV